MIRPTGWGISIQPQETTNAQAAAIAAALSPRWYHSWSVEPFAGVTTPFVPLVWDGRRTNEDARRRALQALRNHTWLMFNEPERPEQSGISPAAALDAVWEFLADARWSAGVELQWAAPGVSLTTPDHDGLAWLTEFAQMCRRSGLSRPSYWHIHLNAPSLSALRDAWLAWSRWYETWGACAPVIVSEVCAQNAPLSAQVAVMDWVDGLLRAGLIAGAAWFIGAPSTFVDWPNSALCTLDGQRARLTPLGAVWETTARSAKP